MHGERREGQRSVAAAGWRRASQMPDKCFAGPYRPQRHACWRARNADADGWVSVRIRADDGDGSCVECVDGRSIRHDRRDSCTAAGSSVDEMRRPAGHGGGGLRGEVRFQIPNQPPGQAPNRFVPRRLPSADPGPRLVFHVVPSMRNLPLCVPSHFDRPSTIAALYELNEIRERPETLAAVPASQPRLGSERRRSAAAGDLIFWRRWCSRPAALQRRAALCGAHAATWLYHDHHAACCPGTCI